MGFTFSSDLRVLGRALGVSFAALMLGACSSKMPAHGIVPAHSIVQNTNVQSGTYGPWKSAPIGGGGYLQQVVFAPSDAKRMYMTSDVGGLFRSDNSGQTWRMLHGSLPPDAGSYSVRGIAVHPRDANRVLIGLGNQWGSVKGIWLTTNGGASWKQILADAAFEANGWHRSAGNVVVMSPHNPNFIVAAPLGKGIMRSSDGGKTWQRSGPDDLCGTHVLFDRSNPRRIWVMGREWGEYKVKRADGTEVGLRGGLFLSEDAGKTWTQIGNESPGEMVQDPKNPAVLWGLINEKQVVRSTDKGQNWVRHSQGLPAKGGGPRDDGTYEGIAVGPDFLLLGGQGGHFYRLDGDWKTWKKIEPTKIEEGNWWGRIEKFRHFGSALGYIGINPRDPKHWVFTDWYALYQSRDAGKTWKLTVDGVEMTVLNTVAQEPTNPQVFHTGMADIGYFRSPDGGRTMQQITRDISNNIKNISPALGQPGRIYATGPRGHDWYVNELFISDDSGLTWRRSGLNGIPDMENRRCETVAPHPAKKDEVWLTVSGDIKPNEGGPWRSLDGGKTWSWQGHGLPQDGEFFHKNYWVAGPELSVSPDGSMVATSNNRGLIARRGPNDAQWTMVKTPAGGPNCIAADVLRPGRFYVTLKEGGLWRSDDGGENWKNVIDGDAHWVSPDMVKANRVVVNTPNRVLVSLDAGATWREMSRALPYRHPRNVVCFAGDNVVVGTGGNGVFYAPISSLQGTPKRLARGVVDAAPVARTSVNIARNGDMTRGEATPAEWSLADWKEGHLILRRDLSTHVSAPASLVVETKGKASGVAQQSLQPTPKGEVKVAGKIRTQGTFENVQAVLQVFDSQWKQIDYKVIADGPKKTADWTTFTGTQNVRDDAAYVLLNLAVAGNGKVWLDDVTATSNSAPQTAQKSGEVSALPMQIAASDARLRYIGRFDWSDKAAPRAAWPASTITIRFRGTDLNAKLRGANNVRWQIEVDGKPTEKIKVGDGENLYRIASGFKNGEHTVRLVQATEALFGTTQVLGWQLNSGAQLLPIAPKTRRIEVIGDSISAGYGNEAGSKDDKFSPDTQNAYFTYGAFAARELNADYTILAWSGKKMWPDNTLPELYDRTIPTEESSRWNFKAPAPDVVVINLATNDFAGGIPDEAGWTKGYKEFIARVRKHYPDAQIYCAIGTMMGDWGESKPLTTLRGYLQKVVKETNDPKVKIIDFGTQDAANGFGADWHPNIKTNQIMANQLVQTLRKDLGW